VKQDTQVLILVYRSMYKGTCPVNGQLLTTHHN